VFFDIFENGFAIGPADESGIFLPFVMDEIVVIAPEGFDDFFSGDGLAHDEGVRDCGVHWIRIKSFMKSGFLCVA
jgi:hypothetical protein